MPEDERRAIEEWRRDRLVDAGYPADYAVGLAINPDVDLYVAIGLLEHGCAVATAVEILS